MTKTVIARAAAAVGISAALVLAAAAPAHAEPWDGNDFEFGLGEWEASSNPFQLQDVYLVFPDDSTEYTDIWDGMGYTTISSASLGIIEETVDCDTDADVDIATDAATGDLVLTCVADSAAFSSVDLVVTQQIRIYATSDLIRVTTQITNEGVTDAVIDAVEYYTDFGTSGELAGYQGQSDALLPVPAAEDGTSRAILADAGSQWAVHSEESDAPGGLAWGSAGAAAPAEITDLSSDEYTATVSSFTVPAGQSRTTAYFAMWTPALLISLDYTNASGNGQEEATAALVEAMSELDSFSGRLTVGLEGQTVVNWGPLAPVAPAEPQLAATGSDASAPAAIALGLLVLGGLALTVVARRRSATR